MAVEPAILVNGLYKSFGDNSVLSNVDLAIDWGTQLTVFGSNGSGKTTLLKLSLIHISEPTRPY